MVARMALDHLVGVRVPIPQNFASRSRREAFFVRIMCYTILSLHGRENPTDFEENGKSRPSFSDIKTGIFVWNAWSLQALVREKRKKANRKAKKESG